MSEDINLYEEEIAKGPIQSCKRKLNDKKNNVSKKPKCSTKVSKEADFPSKTENKPMSSKDRHILPVSNLEY